MFDFVLKMFDFVLKMLETLQLLALGNGAPGEKNDECCIKNEEFCIKNEEFCRFEDLYNEMLILTFI